MRGKKTSPEMIYKVMAVWAVTDSYSETARRLNVPETTVCKIVKEHEDDPEFVKLCIEKRDNFSKNAERIIQKAVKRLEFELDRTDKDIPINHLSTVIGTLVDKKALVDGNPTDRLSVEIKLPEGADEYAE